MYTCNEHNRQPDISDICDLGFVLHIVEGRVMGNVYIETEDGRIEKLGEIECVDITPVEELKYYYASLKSESMSFECQIENFDEFEKQVVYGGNRGLYNGHVLARDGYLNGENAWL